MLLRSQKVVEFTFEPWKMCKLFWDGLSQLSIIIFLSQSVTTLIEW